MSSARKLIVAALLLGACSGKAETQAQAQPAPVHVPADAGVVNVGPTVTYDPTAGHLDDGPIRTASVQQPAPRRATRPIELVLRSTPNGAKVFVDGEDRGITPVLWQGESGQHEFRFTKDNHAAARYRFWAITNGTVHARLEPVVEEVKGGTPQPPELVSPQVPAPSTLVSPDAPVMTAPVDAAVPLATDAAAPSSTIDAAAGGQRLPF